MTDPKENEEVNQELSTDELKSVSGGLIEAGDADYWQAGASGTLGVMANGGLRSMDFKNGHGTGSGMTEGDWKKRNGSDYTKCATGEH